MKNRIALTVGILIAMPATAEEIGIGRDHDIPDAPPPSDPAPAETSGSFLQELIELFHLDNDTQQ